MENYYNFTAHNVFTLPANTDKVFAAPDKLLVTSVTKMSISIHDLGAKGIATHEIDTRGVIQSVGYCTVNNRVATIEDHILHVFQIWWLPEPRVKSLGHADCMAWCHSSGKLAVSNGQRVTVYDELLPLIEFTGVSDIVEMALCDNVLTVRTSGYVLAVDLHENKYPTPDGEVMWNFDREDLIINSSTLASEPRNQKYGTRSQITDEITEVYLPDRPIYGLNLSVNNISNDHIYQPKVLLFRRIQPIAMSLIAYHSCVEGTKPDPLASVTGKLEFVTLMLGDELHCELFCVKGSRGKGLIQFKERAKSIAVDECFMHVLTSDSLITYSLPLPGLSSCWEPYYLSTHRMNMNSLLMSRDHLVVLSGREMGDMTVYSLLKPTTSEFFGDLLTSGGDEVLRRAEDVVRLQFRIHGESCSERLLALYRNIEESKPAQTLEDILDNHGDYQKLKEVFFRTDLELIIKDGFITSLGEKLLSQYPETLEIILSRSNYVSPKTLRVLMAKATPKMAVIISHFACSHLGRVEGPKIHRKLLQNSVPPWMYELPPFNGSPPETQCSAAAPGCKCLRCSAGLLYAAVVLSSAPINIRFVHIYPALPTNVPDMLKLACLLPMSKSSSAKPAHYAAVSENIIAIVRSYTYKKDLTAPHLLTVLSDALTLDDFLKCVPEACRSLVPWVENGLMRQRAERLKQEIIKLGEELRPLMP